MGILRSIMCGLAIFFGAIAIFATIMEAASQPSPGWSAFGNLMLAVACVSGISFVVCYGVDCILERIDDRAKQISAAIDEALDTKLQPVINTQQMLAELHAAERTSRNGQVTPLRNPTGSQ